MSNKLNEAGNDIERIYFFSESQLVLFATLYSTDDLTVNNINIAVSECIERNMKNSVTSMAMLSDDTIQSMINCWLATDYHDALCIYSAKFSAITDDPKLNTPLSDYFWSDDLNDDRIDNDTINESVSPLHVESELCLIDGYAHTIVKAKDDNTSIVVQNRYDATFITVYEDNYYKVMINPSEVV